MILSLRPSVWSNCNCWFLRSGQVVMAVARGPFLAAVLLFLSSGHRCLSPPPACPDLCSCQSDPVLLNCSSAGLYLVPQHIPDSVSEMHLSHNHLPSVALDRRLLKLQSLWLDNNSLTNLSLCMERARGGRRGRRMRPWRRQGCDSWAPSLQLLSVESNQLQQLPEGESVPQNHSQWPEQTQRPPVTHKPSYYTVKYLCTRENQHSIIVFYLRITQNLT